MSLKIIFTGGGTLGSVTPLLAVAEELRTLAPDVEMSWIGTTDGPEAALVREAGMAFHGIAAGKFHRRLTWRHFGQFGRVVGGFFQAFGLLGRLKPHAVSSAGSFVAVPVVWAAWLRRVPVHVHQLDLRPGLANRLSAPFAAALTVSFEKSLNDYRRPKPVLTGTPIRRALLAGTAEEGRRLFGLSAGRPVILVTGGGTGAMRINDLVCGAATRICAAADILHLTGRGKSRPWPEAPVGYHTIDFVTDAMRHAYAMADLVVTRAGIGALTEIAALGKPAIIIPIAGTHQEENAAYFLKAGAALVLDERETTPDGFAAAILGLLADRSRLAAMQRCLASLDRPGAADSVASVILLVALRMPPLLTGTEESAKVSGPLAGDISMASPLDEFYRRPMYAPKELTEEQMKRIADFLGEVSRKNRGAAGADRSPAELKRPPRPDNVEP